MHPLRLNALTRLFAAAFGLGVVAADGAAAQAAAPLAL